MTVDALDDEPIFVVGMPRSGNTLLRSLLNAHPAVGIAGETNYLQSVVPRNRHLDLSVPEDFERFWVDFSPRLVDKDLAPDVVKAAVLRAGRPDFRSVFTEFLRAYARQAGKRRWGEKTPSHAHHLDELLEWYPRARVLFAVRDPRAVLASFRALAERGARWAKAPDDEWVAKWAETMALADRWAKDARVRLVHYERLVMEPDAEMTQVCEFLGETYADEMVGPGRGRRGPKRHGSYDVHGPVSTQSVDQWRTELSPRQIATAEHIAGVHLARYGYEPAAPGLGRAWRLRLAVVRRCRPLRRAAGRIRRWLRHADLRKRTG